MPAYAQRVVGTASMVNYRAVGAFPGGYAVMHDITNDDFILVDCNGNAPAEVDSYSYNGVLTTTAVTAGPVALTSTLLTMPMEAGGTPQVTRITRSGDTLSVNYGANSFGAAYETQQVLTLPDGSGLLHYLQDTGTSNKAHNEYDAAGTEVWSWNTGTPANSLPLVFISSARWLREGTGQLELVDDTGATLDSVAWTKVADHRYDYILTAAGDIAVMRHRSASLTSSAVIYMRILGVSGDTIDWQGAEVAVLTTDWAVPPTTQTVSYSAVGDTLVVANATTSTTEGSSIYWIDMTTAEWASTVFAPGVVRFSIVALSATSTLVVDYADATGYLLKYPQGTLRQRQSPVRTPSRVRPTNLRQRQSPYTT